MGSVADIFPPVLKTLPGELAIGHTRYSTAGDTVLLNAQPFSVTCNRGAVAVAHNGNITNATELRAELSRRGAIFQASSDTEVVLHLVAQSSERTFSGALRDALLQLEGAFSLVFLAQDRIIVARDPHGFRPLAMGEMEVSGGRKCYVFASETCAFDLIGAVYLHDVEPGEMVIVGPEGVTRERYAPKQPLAQCAFEHVYFSRPDSIVFGRPVAESREQSGPVAGAGMPGRCRSGGAGARFRRVGGDRLFGRIGLAVPAGADPQSLRGPHVYRALAGHSRFRREAEAESGAASAGRQARGAGGRFHRARHDQPKDCAHGAAGGRARSSLAHLVSAYDFALLLRRGYADARRVDRGEPEHRGDPPLCGGGFAGIPVPGFAAEGSGGRQATSTATRATPAIIRPSW